MISPSIGRKVWFHPNGVETLNGATYKRLTDQPFDASVVHVWGDRMVNLAVFDHTGIHFALASTPLLQDDDPAPAPGIPYATWMPYQVGQAKKNETKVYSDGTSATGPGPLPELSPAQQEAAQAT